MNLQKMLKQAQEMQSKIGEVQSRLEAEEIEGVSGGGMVKAVINGKGLALRLSIDPKLVDVSEKEMLEDLVIAAFNDAKQKMDAHFSDQMGKVTAGLPMPPGFKLPF